MHTAMGSDPAAEGWAAACEAAFARRLAQPDRFAAFVVEVDGHAVSSGAGWLEELLPSRARWTAGAATWRPCRRSRPPARGHGRIVLAALMGWFVELGVPRVDLRATSDGRALYESFGFRELGAPRWRGPPPGRPGRAWASPRAAEPLASCCSPPVELLRGRAAPTPR
jgi:hypothetical protein